MKKYINKTLAGILGISMLFAGCTNSFEEINTNPDKPVDVPVENIFAYATYWTAFRLYDRWFAQDEPQSFCGYVSKMNYIDEAKYQYRASIRESNWEYLYGAFLNFRDVQERTEEINPNLYHATRVMEAHVIQIATDRWRDVPYTEAGKLSEGILTPKYDTQEEIYPALLTLLKDAADGFADNNSGTIGGDLLFGGDVTKWQKYCNSLRLRLAIRISEVSPALAKQTVEEVLGNPGRYPVMTSNDDNAFFWWTDENATYYEPIADQFRTRQAEYCASDVMVDYMVENADPRIGVFFDPTPLSQMPDDEDYTPDYPKYRGYTIGASSNAIVKLYSIWGYKYAQDLAGFSPFMRVAEVYFHIAEASMLGYNTGTTAEEAYNKAVRFSMEENEVSPEDIETYMADAGKFDGTIKKIWYEEYIAMFKQAMEGWSLYRRTGMPETMYIAPGRANIYSNHNVPPFRSPYPITEMNLNGANNAPYNAEIVDDFWGKQMWWDTRTGVY
ncbi:MAG: SusD/RagB family nutrient-binding outer membrane lipoprotein [Tannerellaceae bacterium]|nr:SusD/RagB family nutrient-binding outer membrane lipoprotein [Tannerellaceae bacterium]